MKVAPNSPRSPDSPRSIDPDCSIDAPHPPLNADLQDDPQMHNGTIGHGSEACVQSYATPLMPLRDRDLQTLSDLFASDEIEAIEADILSNLTRLLPEPCWEDDPFDFLKDYL